MKCGEAQREIPRLGDEDLADTRARELREHLARCPDCSAWADTVRGVEDMARRHLPAGEPPAHLLSRVREVALAEPQRGRVVRFPRLPLQWLAYAAGLALVLGVWFMLRAATGNRRIERMADVASLVFPSENRDVTTSLPAAEALKKEHRLHALGRQLLVMEGLDSEEQIELEALEPEASGDEEPSPTALRSSNIPACPG